MQNWLSNHREDDHGEEEEKKAGEEGGKAKNEGCARAQGQGESQIQIKIQAKAARGEDDTSAAITRAAGIAADDAARSGGDADRAAADFVSVVELSGRVPDALQRECEA